MMFAKVREKRRLVRELEKARRDHAEALENLWAARNRERRYYNIASREGQASIARAVAEAEQRCRGTLRALSEAEHALELL